MEQGEIIKALSALAQPNRLQVFRALVAAGPEGMTPGVIGDVLDVPASTLSFHLKELMNANLVSQERSGRHLIYRADYERMSGVLAYLTANCCQGQPCPDSAEVSHHC